jgi:hypothetical protein
MWLAPLTQAVSPLPKALYRRRKIKMSDPIVVIIPDDDDVMYINGNTLAEIIDGQEHHDYDVVLQLPVFQSPADLFDWLKSSSDDAG